MPLQPDWLRQSGKFPDRCEQSADDHKDRVDELDVSQSIVLVLLYRVIETSEENVDHGLDRTHTTLYRGSDYRVIRRTRRPQFWCFPNDGHDRADRGAGVCCSLLARPAEVLDQMH